VGILFQSTPRESPWFCELMPFFRGKSEPAQTLNSETIMLHEDFKVDYFPRSPHSLVNTKRFQDQYVILISSYPRIINKLSERCGRSSESNFLSHSVE
jgi:hypothetical protein